MSEVPLSTLNPKSLRRVLPLLVLARDSTHSHTLAHTLTLTHTHTSTHTHTLSHSHSHTLHAGSDHCSFSLDSGQPEPQTPNPD